ncbi:MAG: hypothetical protein Q7T82_02055 [Armatimonadota bacterium]|nr:hypothetical protein [Armatimonadota bacterium]
MRKRKKASFSTKAASAVFDLSGLGLVLGGLVLLAAGVYLAYGFKSGGIQQLAELPAIDRGRVIQNLALVCRAATTAGLIVVVCAIIRYYVEETLGYALSIAGALLYFAPPLLLGSLMSSTKPTSLAVGIVGSRLQTLGMTALAPGLALLLRDLIGRLVRLLTRPRLAAGMVWGREARESVSPLRRIYGRCWEMPHCRAFIRSICPAYNVRKSCWRVKCGCYCDERTIIRAIEAQSGGATPENKRAYSQLLVRQPALTGAEKRERCRNCSIYSEHQRQKYRILSPLIFPGVALAILLTLPRIHIGLKHAVAFTDRFMRSMSFTPQGGIGPSEWSYYVSATGTIQWLFIAWLSIMAISYALRLIEYCVFKIQI